MIKIACIVLFQLVLISVMANDSIRYHDKSIRKEFLKISKNNDFDFSQMNISDSIIKRYRIHGKYFVNNKESDIKFMYIGRVNSCRVGGCSVSNNLSTAEEFEFFDYVIFYDANKNIRNIKVFNYQATHGQEITARGWLKQFIGYNGKKDLQVGKDVDAISGATISVYGITFDVQLKTEVLISLNN